MQIKFIIIIITIIIIIIITATEHTKTKRATEKGSSNWLTAGAWAPADRDSPQRVGLQSE